MNTIPIGAKQVLVLKTSENDDFITTVQVEMPNPVAITDVLSRLERLSQLLNLSSSVVLLKKESVVSPGLFKGDMIGTTDVSEKATNPSYKKKARCRKCKKLLCDKYYRDTHEGICNGRGAKNSNKKHNQYMRLVATRAQELRKMNPAKSWKIAWNEATEEYKQKGGKL